MGTAGCDIDTSARVTNDSISSFHLLLPHRLNTTDRIEIGRKILFTDWKLAMFALMHEQLLSVFVYTWKWACIENENAPRWTHWGIMQFLGWSGVQWCSFKDRGCSWHLFLYHYRVMGTLVQNYRKRLTSSVFTVKLGIKTELRFSYNETPDICNKYYFKTNMTQN